MNEQKTIRILKEIFDRCGPEILRDNRRFEANLMDLFGKSFHCAERMVLCHALDSNILPALAEAPTITEAGAKRTAERLEKECRLKADDAVFVTRCVIAARGGNPDLLPWPAPPSVRAKRYWVVILCIALFLGVFILAVYYYLRSARYEDLYRSESAQSAQTKQLLAAANARLSENQSDWEDLDKTLDSVRSSLDKAEQDQEKLQEKLKATEKQLVTTQTALNTTQASLDATQQELYKLGRGEYGYASENYHADRGIITLKPNETGNFSIYGAYPAPATYFLHSSDSDGLEINWNQQWNGNLTGVIVTARLPGSYVLTFTNSENSETFEVLIVVPYE